MFGRAAMTACMVDQVSRLPLFDDVDPGDLAELAGSFRPVQAGDGHVLIRQGDPPDGAYFIVDGKVEVVTRLPGGGEAFIAEVGPGSLLGELALIRSTRRGATVRARGEVGALFVDRGYFRAALAQLRPGAMKVSLNIARFLARRLHSQYGRIGDYVETHAIEDFFVSPPATAEAERAKRPPAFDLKSFLPILPRLREFDPSDVDRLMEATEILETSPGDHLDPGSEGDRRGFIVVRGSAIMYLPVANRAHQLDVLGPGRFCSIGQMLDTGRSPVRYFLRHPATLLSIPEARFAAMVQGRDLFAQRLLTAVNEHHADMITRASNHFTRLVAMSRQAGRPDGGVGDVVI